MSGSIGGRIDVPSQTTTLSGQYNVNSQSLPHWRKAVANVRAGTGRARLILIGDSTTCGVGSGSGGTTNLNGAFATAVSRGVATLLNTYVPTSDKTLFNNQNVGQTVTYSTYDTRVSFGAGWVGTGNIVVSVGGDAFKYTNGSATALNFTPAGNIDTIKVWYLVQAGQGQFTVSVDGGASLGTVTTAGTTAITSSSFSCTKTTHTVNLNALNNGTIFLLGVETSDSTVPAVDIIQGGISGSVAATWTATGNVWVPTLVLPALTPDLTIINLTINDSTAQTSMSSYTANIQALITAAQSTGDCMLMVGAPSNNVQATNGTLAGYAATLRALALLNNCSMIDISTRWTSYAVTNPIMAYFDNLHPTAVGYYDIATAIVEVLSAA